MAYISHLLLVLFALFFSTEARHISHQNTDTATTSTLDVATTLSQANAAAAFDPQRLIQEHDHLPITTITTVTKGRLTLRLRSRDFISRGQQSYGSLMRARLARDAARVHSITTHVSSTLNNVSIKDLKPVTNGTLFLEASAAIRGPVVSGTSLGSGEYFSRIGVGSPAVQMFVVLDTGSDVNWIQCEPCSDCYQQTDPVFDPSASSTFSPLPCNSNKCQALDISACRSSAADNSGTCLYQVSYGDGSYTVGDFVKETLTLGGSSPVSNIAIGCGHDNEGLFVGAAGLLALGGGPLSFPSQINAKSFSYCLVDRNSPASSTLELGTSEAAVVTPSDAVTAPLVHNPKIDTYRYVEMTGISVGGTTLAIPPTVFAVGEDGSGGVIVDCGTAVTRLNSAAYAALRDAFREGTAGLPPANGVVIFDTCYDLSSRTSVDVPTVAFHFPAGKEVRLPAKNYLIPVDASGTYCLAFAPTSSALSIIGNVQQQGMRVSFDLQNKMIGFTPSSC